MPHEPLPHHAYLVRCWQEGKSPRDGQPVWRFSIEEVLHKRQSLGFRDLNALIAFLRHELGSDADHEKSNHTKEGER